MKTVAQMLLAKSKQPTVRLMGFREWCEKVYEPSMVLREERWLLLEAQRLNMKPVSSIDQRLQSGRW